MNLWILTEEKPKTSVISQIAALYAEEFSSRLVKAEAVRVVPIMKGTKFSFTYVVQGLDLSGIDSIFIKTVSGSTSFVDFLVFRQNTAPVEGSADSPIMAIEETKTSDAESRNTGVCQRVTKFVYIDAFFPDVKKYMLYNEELQADETRRPSDTNIIGTNILLTLGVKIVGKDLRWFRPYKTVDEIISAKNSQRQPPAGNVPVRLEKVGDTIYISGRLAKPKDAGNIGHDPSIGTLSMLAKGLRALGWNGSIVITKHGVSQSYMDRSGARNKFIYVCSLLNMKLEGIDLPRNIEHPQTYWHYERRSEKVASILLHILAENNGLLEVYQNHAGCERGYFFSKARDQITLPKKDTHGKNLLLPDVVMFDIDENMAILVEGKQLSTLYQGVREIKGYDSIENEYIKVHYPHSTTYRCVSIFGGDRRDIPHDDVLLYLNDDGYVFINQNAPKNVIADLAPGPDSFVEYEVIDF